MGVLRDSEQKRRPALVEIHEKCERVGVNKFFWEGLSDFRRYSHVSGKVTTISALGRGGLKRVLAMSTRGVSFDSPQSPFWTINKSSKERVSINEGGMKAASRQTSGRKSPKIRWKGETGRHAAEE